MRTDAKKNLQKVATEAIKDPSAKQEDIAKKTGLSLGNVNDKLKKLEKEGVIDRTSAIIAIEETDLEIVTLTQSITLEKLQDEDQRAKMSITDLALVGEKSQKRYSFLSGENANKDGGEKEVKFQLEK